MNAYAVYDRLSPRHKWQLVVDTLDQSHAKRVYDLHEHNAREWFQKNAGKYPQAQIAFLIHSATEKPNYDPLPANYPMVDVKTIGA